MKPPKSLRALAVATPLALAASLASAPLASAGINDAALNNPHVLDQGTMLGVVFNSAISDDTTDNAIARNTADTFVGNWAGALVEYALRNTPPRVSTCRVIATATDSDGATGTTSAAVPAGVTHIELDIPDQAPHTKWGIGDLDHFAVQLTCTDTQRGTQESKATIDQDETAD